MKSERCIFCGSKNPKVQVSHRSKACYTCANAYKMGKDDGIENASNERINDLSSTFVSTTTRQNEMLADIFQRLDALEEKMKRPVVWGPTWTSSTETPSDTPQNP